VRPLAIAAGTVVIAALLVVLWRSAALPLVVGVLGAVLLVLGLGLALTAVLLTARLRTEVLLEPEAVTVVRGGRRRSVSWSQVREVTLEHPRLTLVSGDSEAGLVVVNPRSAGDRRFGDLVASITQRLDSDRGYRELG